MARSDSYKDIVESRLDEIESWIERGETDKDVAERLGIAYSTYRKYKANSVALKERIATIKDKMNQEVEKALYKGCIGYDYYEEVVTKVKEEVMADDGKTILVQEKVKISKVKKHRAADLNAQRYWLNNKKKAEWKEDPHKVSHDKKALKIKEKVANASIIEI